MSKKSRAIAKIQKQAIRSAKRRATRAAIAAAVGDAFVVDVGVEDVVKRLAQTDSKLRERDKENSKMVRRLMVQAEEIDALHLQLAQAKAKIPRDSLTVGATVRP